MQTTNIIGHKSILDLLSRSLSNGRVSHAYIFEGATGIGKKTVADYFARALVCENNLQAPCGICKGCLMSIGGSHPDINVIAMPEDENGDTDKKAAKSISVNTIRQARKDIYIRPVRADKKVYIICDAQKLTDEAQNSFLKVLEEPPDYTVIILITTNIEALFNTVQSRAVAIKFGRLLDDDIRKYIASNYPEQLPKGQALTAIAQGNIGQLLQALTDSDRILMRLSVKDALPVIFGGDESRLFELFCLYENYKDDFDKLQDTALSILRDIIMIKSGMTKMVINSDFLIEIEDMCRTVSKEKILSILDIFYETNKNIKYNVNFSLGIMSMLIRSWEEKND